MNLLFGISMWHLSFRFSQRLFIAIVSQIQNMTVDPGFNGRFFVGFLARLQTIKMSPCKQRLMGRWEGEINTIKSDSRNILSLFKIQSVLFWKKGQHNNYKKKRKKEMCLINYSFLAYTDSNITINCSV